MSAEILSLTRPELSLDRCRERLERLRGAFAEAGADAAVVHEPDVIRWATGSTSMHGWPGALIVTDRTSVAILFATAERPSVAAEQAVLPGISRDRAVDHHQELADAAHPHLRAAAGGGRAVAVDRHGAPAWVVAGLAEVGAGPSVDLAPILRRLRRRKDDDEVALIEHGVALCEVAYRAAAEVIAPGVRELDVYLAMAQAVQEAAGTSVELGGDFMAGPGGGETGGPPSRRVLADGDAYVIDFFPHEGGYWADMCRTYVVGEAGGPLAGALDATREALAQAESMLRPGTRTADVDRAIRERLDAWRPGAGDFFHGSGHGLGLRPHEAPWIVAGSDEVLEVGDVIAVEPGVYLDDLRGGVRIEDDYVITEGGLQRLSDLPR